MIDWLIEVLFEKAVIIGSVIAVVVLFKIRGFYRENFRRDLRRMASEVSYVSLLGSFLAAGIAFMAVAGFELEFNKLHYFREQAFAFGLIGAAIAFLGLLEVYLKKPVLRRLLLWIFGLDTAGQRDDFEPASYPQNWAVISYSYRKRKNFTCEECGVNLASYPHLTDCHHINGVKSDCRDENLRCLCKECHQKRDTHYKVSEEDLAIAREERQKQGK